MDQSILGARVRERRRQAGLTQAELARRLKISASYLNLIEHDKRPIAGALLRRIAGVLGVAVDALDSSGEMRLVDSLNEIARLPALQGLGVETEALGALVGRHPGWARALAALARSEQEAWNRARALGDRLTHDVFLGESVHRMLTRIAAIRSAAEILVETPNVPADRQTEFQGIILTEAKALTGVAEALAAYFDRIGEAERSLTPLDEVEALFDANANRFEGIEAAATALHRQIVEPSPAARLAAARELARSDLAAEIDAVLGQGQEIATDTARARARASLLAYGAHAILAPMDRFEPLAASLGYDVEAIADAAAVDIEIACRRLTALPEAAGTPRFGYFRANAAGAIIEMRGLPGLAAPRYAAACPLWALYRAQQSPGQVLRQRTLFPTGARFVFLARARPAGPAGFGRPRHYVTDMLAMSEASARLTVYAPGADTLLEDVGPACRLCPRKACPHRVEDPLGE